ncbi:hypothetical protein C0Z16_19520 [Paraburkholderia rhynchosiae]|uniref:Uncharacterized protein n=1 Tax=Paraburkholderia rhynchosiae TaxID=487049 RepID=A0ABX4V2G6_9BURK|nr:hypothetical protein C0Z16_19520 [Paraburkholderia rhynchosiae]
MTPNIRVNLQRKGKLNAAAAHFTDVVTIAFRRTDNETRRRAFMSPTAESCWAIVSGQAEGNLKQKAV